MELVGEEKKIQALFSELKLEHQLVTPRFNSMWLGAGSRTLRPRKPFRLSLIAAMGLFVFSLFSLAMWLMLAPPIQQPGVAVTSAPANLTAGSSQTTISESSNRPSTVMRHNRAGVGPRPIRLATRREAAILAARRVEIRNAAAISSWQSPTITLLRSPGDEVLSSLPQLNGSANELRSFLPGSNDY